jgi:polar amino acid transport system ATP-binding protein
MNSEKDIIIDVKNLHKFYYDNHILKGLDFSIEKGELISVIGRSGCGKTTMLRCLNLLEYFDEGTIRIAGITLNRQLKGKNKKKMMQRARDFGNKVVKPFVESGDEEIIDEDFQIKALTLRKRVGMLFQSLNLFPHLTVLENVTLAPILVNGMNKAASISEAKKLLDKVELSKFSDRYPAQLSGGQAQRVAIARALAMNPQVMLYDEPTSALDPELVAEVIKVMNKLHNDGMTQIVVTHALSFAKNASDRVMFMEGGEIIEFTTPDEIFNNPKHESTKKYIKILED